jgi:hypothetical protein
MTVSVGRLRSATPVRWSSDLVPREVLSWRRRPKTWQNPASTQESWGRDSDQRCLGPAAQVASRVHERTVEVEALHRLAAAASRRSTPRSGCSSGQSESARKPMCQRAPLAAWTGCIRRLLQGAHSAPEAPASRRTGLRAEAVDGCENDLPVETGDRTQRASRKAMALQ